MNETSNNSPVPAPVEQGAKQPLDEVMLAMDIVDTIRRRERMVKRELDAEGREEDLKERLRKIYAAQGIEVSDHVIEEGVAAISEERFVYKPVEQGFQRKLAVFYVTRNKWGKWLLGILAAFIIAAVIYHVTITAPAAELPKRIDELHTEIVKIAAVNDARTAADQIRTTGMSALSKGNTDAAKAAIASLEDLRNRLNQEYTVIIVNRHGEQSGVWRIPDVNTKARNYYLIVEAVDSSGNILTLPILNEETGKTERVSRWGLRVDEHVFNTVSADKQDDGIIQMNRIGRKQQGHLEPVYSLPTAGDYITRW